MARACILVVTGTRHPLEREKPKVWRELDRVMGEVSLLIHGDAAGVDTWAGEWAFSRGIRCEAMQADWSSYGRAAGVIRNQEMLDRARFLATVPGSVALEVRILGFPGNRVKSAGTRHCLGLAMRLGIKLQGCVALDTEEEADVRKESHQRRRGL